MLLGYERTTRIKTVCFDLSFGPLRKFDSGHHIDRLVLKYASQVSYVSRLVITIVSKLTLVPRACQELDTNTTLREEESSYIICSHLALEVVCSEFEFANRRSSAVDEHLGKN